MIAGQALSLCLLGQLRCLQADKARYAKAMEDYKAEAD